MIVDDQYPTWEEILNPPSWVAGEDDFRKPKNPKEWWATPETPLGVIRDLRDHDPGILIDINDGAAPPKGMEPAQYERHLHQSDLLILDYQLDGAGGDGRRSVDIAQQLLTRGHFNLIVLHTQKNIDIPFNEILLSLMSGCPSLEDKADKINQATELIEDTGDPSIQTRLKEAFTPALYFAVLKDPKVSLSLFMTGQKEFSALSLIADDITDNKGNKSKLFLWLLKEFEKQHIAGDVDQIDLSWSDNNHARWIRTDFGFIAFAQKATTTDLISTLQAALVDWKPTPSRLLAAKYRHMLDEKSGIAEAEVFADQLGYARFYEEIHHAPQAKAISLIDDHIRRQNELTLGAVEHDVRDYGQRLLQFDLAAQAEQKLLLNYGHDLENYRDKAVLSFNHHVSTMPTHGYHLRCGHIFSFSDAKWVIVTPACDLVPGQTATGFDTGSDGHHRPFIAARLYPVAKKTLANDEISSNKYLFLKVDGEVKIFGIFPGKSGGSADVTKVTWRNFIAADDGKISADRSFSVAHLDATNEELALNQTSLTLEAEMLRYENALHLNQLFVQTLGRIGLDFIRDKPNQ